MIGTRLLLGGVLACVTVQVAVAQPTSRDDAVLARIRAEASVRSQVMQHATRLTNIGPRLTGSPYTRQAGEWAAAELRRWGAVNVALEPWRPFDRPGWVNERVSAQVIAPRPFPLNAYPQAWSRGTRGPQAGEVVLARLLTESDFVRLRGTLRGKWVITDDPGQPMLSMEPMVQRRTDAELDSMSVWDVALSRRLAREAAARTRAALAGAPPAGAGFSARRRRVSRFLYDEGALGRIDAGKFSGGVFGPYAGEHFGSPTDADTRPENVPVIVASIEDIGRMLRLISAGEVVRLEVDMRNRFTPSDGSSFNVIGELPGRDPRVRDEVVMLGAHLDSWQVGTGATDNAAGVAVMLEAMRILAALDLPLRRTVRVALWTGEEQRMLGSEAYVRAHFGHPDSTGAHFTPAHEKLSGYFNLDNGGGSIRGIATMENDAVTAIMRPWIEPLRNIGVRVVTSQPFGGSDHVSFDAAGLPALKFIQDPLDYFTRSWHSNQDLFERLQTPELMRNAVTVAWLVYKTAMLDERLPRAEFVETDEP